MRERYDKHTLESAIENSYIMLDTNVLIDLYDLENEAIIELLEKLRGQMERLWLPFQVYSEYYKHRERKVKERVNRIIGLGGTISSEINLLIGRINGIYNDKNIAQERVREIGRNFLNDLNTIEMKFRQELQEYIQQTNNEEQPINIESDIIMDFVEELHITSNTEGFKGYELLEIFAEGQKRYQFSCPPGFTDKGKENVNSKEKKTFETYIRVFGDLIIWKEILRKVRRERKNLIFIENEKKKDWLTDDEKRSVPKILSDEYEESSNGGKIFIVDLLEFNFYFKDYLGISDETFKNIESRYERSNL